MSKGHWKKHEEADEEILEILGKGEIMTAHVIWYELKGRGFKISYGAVQRRLEGLKEKNQVRLLENSVSNQKIWTIHNFLKE